MKKKNSIKKSYQIKWILRKGKEFDLEQFKIRLVKNNKKYNRTAIILKKGINSSVLRNGLKRKIREAFRLIANKIIQGYDILFVIENSNNLKELKELKEIKKVKIEKNAKENKRRSNLNKCNENKNVEIIGKSEKNLIKQILEKYKIKHLKEKMYEVLKYNFEEENNVN